MNWAAMRVVLIPALPGGVRWPQVSGRGGTAGHLVVPLSPVGPGAAREGCRIAFRSLFSLLAHRRGQPCCTAVLVAAECCDVSVGSSLCCF